MAFRFRKSFKIAPGVRVNIGKSGLSSIGVGPRGASMSFGKSGTHSNVGIPGTGISFRNKVGGTSSKREEQRIQRLQEKLEQEERRIESLSKVSLNLDEEKGSLTILNAFNEPLSRKDLKLMWEQKRNFIQEWLQDEATKINGDINLLENIYLDTPNPNNISLSYKAKKYSIEKPQKLHMPDEPELELPSLGFFASLFKSKREAYQKEIKELEKLFDKELLEWKSKKNKIISEYEKVLLSWDKNKSDFENNQKYYEENFDSLIHSDIELMENLLEEVFDSISWPKETLISYEIDNEGEIVWIDLDLPEIEDLPQKVASLSASGKKLNIKNKAQKQLRIEYAKHIHGIAFRLAGFVFATLPKSKTVIISGYSQRLNSAIGKIEDEYLYSYKVDRENFSKIDFNALEMVDSIQSLDSFEHTKKMTATGIFKEISPFEK